MATHIGLGVILLWMRICFGWNISHTLHTYPYSHTHTHTHSHIGYANIFILKCDKHSLNTKALGAYVTIHVWYVCECVDVFSPRHVCSVSFHFVCMCVLCFPFSFPAAISKLSKDVMCSGYEIAWQLCIVFEVKERTAHKKYKQLNRSSYSEWEQRQNERKKTRARGI